MKPGPDFQALYARFHPHLEDFWGRRENRLAHAVEFRLFGRLFRLSSNHAPVLASAEFSRPAYSIAPETEDPPFEIRIVVHAPPRPPPEIPPALSPEFPLEFPEEIPPDLLDRVHYAGNEDWLNLGFGEWGNCFVDMAAGRATAVLAPEFAARPDLVSRWMLDTVITNLFTRNGFAMLHATALVRENCVLMLIAPHGGGKSTTALHGLLAGDAVLTDSMVYLARREGRLQLTGFPVGRLKLRRDLLPDFPQVEPFLGREQVRGETKYTLDLNRFAPDRVCKQALTPDAVMLCLLGRHDRAGSLYEAADPESLWEAVMLNSLHFDAYPVWQSNLALVAGLLQRARAYRLTAGRDPRGVVAALDALWSGCL